MDPESGDESRVFVIHAVPMRLPRKPIKDLPPRSLLVVLCRLSAPATTSVAGCTSSFTVGPNSVTAAGAEGGAPPVSFLSIPPLVNGLRGRFLFSRSKSAPLIFTVNLFLRVRRGERGSDKSELSCCALSLLMPRKSSGNLADLGDRGTIEGKSSTLSLVTMLKDSSESLGGRYVSREVVDAWWPSC